VWRSAKYASRPTVQPLAASGIMDESLQAEQIAMREKDIVTRARLVDTGELDD
jgi:hypothetical protein